MKNLILFLLVFLSLTINAQTQKIDSVQSEKIQNIEDRLTSFHNSNRNSQFLIIAGSVISIAGTLFYKPQKATDINPFPIIGGGLGLIGGLIYLDSFKFLNMNRKFAKKSTEIDF